MKRGIYKHIKSAGLLLLALACGCTLLLYLMRGQSVLLTVSTGRMIRPRSYCLLNPFRDREPEQVAESYLLKLRAGATHEIASLVGEEKYILEEEAKWPIQSWRVGERKDTTEKTELMYWVKRGNGYSKDGMEEEVRFFMERSEGKWVVRHYGAIY
jgi:hypothetical protein